MIEDFSEIRLANAFKLPSQLTDSDLIEMQRRVKAERAAWNKWQSKLHSGGHSSRESEKGRKYRKKKNAAFQAKMPKSQLSDAEKAALAAGWRQLDAKKAALQAQ